MSEYRRAHIPGGAYFFTLKTFERQPVLTHEHYRVALREAITEVRGRLPFDSLAWVLLPDHIHKFGNCLRAMSITPYAGR
jgi:putative transposase